MSRRLRSPSATLFQAGLVTLLAAPLPAQGVRGVVEDPRNTPIAGVIFQVADGPSVESDARGRFVLGGLPHGPLEIRAERLGFESWTGRVEVPRSGWIELVVELRPAAVELDPLVVTGTLRETRVSDSPVKVDVVSSRVLSRHAAASLMDGVGRINGLYPQIDCGVCYTNNIRINGMEGPYTAILIDGMPILGGLASVYGLNGIHPSIIERLEILKGPQSTLHGPEAMGGVINVVTKDPRFAPEWAVEASRSSVGVDNASLSWAPGSGRSGILLSGSLVHNDDFVDDNGDGFSDLTLDTRASLFGRVTLRRQGRRIGQVAAKAYLEDRFGGVEGWTPDDRGSAQIYGESIRTRRVEAMGTVAGPWADTRVEASVAHHDQDSWYGDMGFAARQTIAFGRLLWDPPRGGSRHDLLAGLALTWNAYDDDTPATPSPDRRLVPGVFVEDRFQAGPAWTLLGGLRADHHGAHGVILSPRAAVMWRPDADATVRLNVGTGFRVVHLFTEDHAALTGARDVVVEGDLDPERSWSLGLNYNQVIEFGTRPMMIDIDAFLTRFENRIIPDYDTHPDRIFYRNLEGRHAVTRGVSVAVNQNFGADLPLFYTLGLTVQDVFLAGGDGPRDDEFFAPRYRGVWSASYEVLRGLTVDYGGAVTGPMRLPEFPEPFARPTRNEPYLTHDLQASWLWTSGAQITVGVQNLTDFRQESPLIDPARPFGDAFDTSYVYGPIVGRRLSVGVRFTRGR